MTSQKTVGIVREWKTATERRVPVVPETVRALVQEEGVRVLVEPSPDRVFDDASYRAAGAVVTEDLSSADFLLGIKEMPAERMAPGRPHLFFSHTIKGQAYNMPLLQHVLDSKATLLDYELVKDERGKRMIFFGVQAGQAGMINSLWTYGQRLQALGMETPLAELRQARSYDSLAEACSVLKAIGGTLKAGRSGPIVVGMTGGGNVTAGACEILDLLEPKTVTPDELLSRDVHELAAGAAVLKVLFSDEHYARRTDGSAFSKAHYRAHPEEYEGRFAEFLPHLSVLLTGHYWEPPFPKLVTREALAALPADARLAVIGDVTCDPGGSVESTTRPTLPDDPCYVYDPATGADRPGFAGEGVAVMAVDILPSEIPREASMAFDAFLRPWLVGLVRADWTAPLEGLRIAAPWRDAIIAHAGQLAPDWAHLQEALANS